MKAAGGESAIRLAIVNAEEPHDDTKGGSKDLRLARKQRNDIGNSERLRTRFGRDLMFVPNRGRHAWAGTHWSLDRGDEQWKLMAQKTVTAMRREADELEAAQSAHKAFIDLDDPKLAEQFRKWTVTSGMAQRLAAMQDVAEPHLAVPGAQLDADHNLFNCQNGSIELGSKRDPGAVRLRRHARGDRITRIAPVGFDPEAQCPRFRAFIDQVLPDREVQHWLQKFLGYSLTGSAREHILVMLLGEGRNGKGTLVRLCLWLWGDYGSTVSFASLAPDDRRRGGDATPDIARLPGVRLLFAAEPRKGVRLDDGRVKELTGEDRQVARHLNHDFFEFDPQFKLAIQANNRPKITDQSTGMWERVRLVPFDVVIPEGDRDPQLLDKLKAEGPGILNWCVDGWRLYREEGLAAAKPMTEATAEYRVESDELGVFLAAATIPDAKGSVRSSHLFACYEGWARAMDLRAISRTKFGLELNKRGHQKKMLGEDRVIWRTGIRWAEAVDWDWQVPQ